MEELLGIEKLKQAVHLALALPFQAVKTIKGKFNLFGILAFVDEFRELTVVIKDIKSVKDEIKDLSPQERTELLEYIKDEFSIPDEKLEIFIENALTFAWSLITLIEEAKALKKK